MVSGAADRTLQRWDVPCRALAALEEAARHSRAAAVAAAATASEAVEDGHGAAGGARKGKGKGKGVWTPPAPLLETARRSVRAHEQDVNCVAVSPNDAVVASASQDRTIKLWKAADLGLIGVLKGHKRGVWKVRGAVGMKKRQCRGPGLCCAFARAALALGYFCAAHAGKETYACLV